MRRIALTLAAAAAALAAAATTAHADTGWESSAPAFPKGQPVSLVISDRTVALPSMRARYWPVAQAVAAWNTSPQLRLTYTRAACQPDVACITVTAGVTANQWYGVYYNDRHVALFVGQGPTTPTHREQTICHELGHALGFGHHPGGGCVGEDRGTTPDAAELALLAAWYGPASE